MPRDRKPELKPPDRRPEPESRRRPTPKASPVDRHFDDLLHSLHEKVNHIMVTQAEHQAGLQRVLDKVNKIHTETTESVRLVGELRTELENGGNMTPEATRLLDEIEQKLQLTDDAVADAVIDPPPPPPPPPPDEV